MIDSEIKILLVEDNLGDARFLRESLKEVEAVRYELIHVERLSNALERIAEKHYDVILLDLILPDSQGFDTFFKIYSQAQNTPVVVLSGLSDEATAIKAVAAGAEDYLVKGQVNGQLLMRSLRYAIERHKMQLALRSQSLVDDLTGLYNRRGFLTLAEQQLKLSRRAKRGFFLVFVDLDGLKQINDSCGHLEGDKALNKTAMALKKTFRETDIIGRIGGDEFMVLAIDALGDSAEIITHRLEESVNQVNADEKSAYLLALSFGVVYFDSKSPLTLEQLMQKTDEALYLHKRSKRNVN
jgi:two-component system cell cycle response regulator